jgi:hypothetical protein
MRPLEAAALAIFFLLIPHQEPRADASEVAAPAARLSERVSGTAVVESDGFVWSVAAGRDFAGARIEPDDHLVIDGYSWSARTDRTALDSTR